MSLLQSIYAARLDPEMGVYGGLACHAESEDFWQTVSSAKASAFGENRVDAACLAVLHAKLIRHDHAQRLNGCCALQPKIVHVNSVTDIVENVNFMHAPEGRFISAKIPIQVHAPESGRPEASVDCFAHDICPA